MGVTGDLIGLRSQMMGDDGVRQWMRADGREEMRSSQRYKVVVSRYQLEISSSNRTNDAGERDDDSGEYGFDDAVEEGETDAVEIDAVWRLNLLSNVERCEMPSEMREEMMSGVRGWVTVDNVIDAEGSRNEELDE